MRAKNAGVRIGFIEFKILLSSDRLHLFSGMFQMALDNFVFAVTTKIPSSPIGGNDDVGALFSPFNRFTWSCLLLSCVLIAGLNMYRNREHSLTPVISIVPEFVSMISLFLGQLGSGLDQIFYREQVPISSMTFCFFGGYILMENLYKGEIFAVLTVQNLPDVPKTFEDLVKSNLLTVTNTKMHVMPESTIGMDLPCMMNYKIIPEVSETLATKFDSLMAQFHPNLKCINRLNNTFFDHVSKSKPYFGGKNSTLLAVHETFAFLDRAIIIVLLEYYFNLMKMIGGQIHSFKR